MYVELICIGTELLRGHLNSNSAYISKKLADIGLELNLISTVEDEKKSLKSFFQKALKRSDIIITTGGLGPTFDDLTREVMAKAMNLKLVFNKELMHNIAAYFAKRDLEMPVKNEQQAYVIEGAEVIPNQIGTASGMIIPLKKVPFSTIVIMLPGPPQEMQPMMERYILPFFKKRYEHKIRKSVILHTCGLAESEVEERINKLVQMRRRLENLNFNLQAHTSIVDIEISVQGKDEIIVDETLLKIKSEIYECLGDNIYGENQETLESVVGNLLNERKLTLAIAESCSGGLISHRVTNVPGSSIYFKQGVIAYSNDTKINVLGVEKGVLSKLGAVSSEVALSMAHGIRKISQADLGLATTGIAGPTGGTSLKPVGLVYLSLVSKRKTICKVCKFVGDRKKIKEEVANSALDLLRRQILMNSF